MAMSDVDKIYKTNLLENGVKKKKSYHVTKKLKKLLQENLPNLVVVKST